MKSLYSLEAISGFALEVHPMRCVCTARPQLISNHECGQVYKQMHHFIEEENHIYESLFSELKRHLR